MPDGDRIDWSSPYARGAAVVGALALGLVALNWRRIAQQARRWALKPALQPARAAIVTADGQLHFAAVATAAAPDRRLRFLAKTPTPPLDDLSQPSVRLTADRQVIIYIDGVQQTSPRLAAGVLAFGAA